MGYRNALLQGWLGVEWTEGGFEQRRDAPHLVSFESPTGHTRERTPPSETCESLGGGSR